MRKAQLSVPIPLRAPKSRLCFHALTTVSSMASLSSIRQTATPHAGAARPPLVQQPLRCAHACLGGPQLRPRLVAAPPSQLAQPRGPGRGLSARELLRHGRVAGLCSQAHAAARAASAGVRVSSAATDLLELTEENVEKVLDEVNSSVGGYSCRRRRRSAGSAAHACSLLEALPAAGNAASEARSSRHAARSIKYPQQQQQCSRRRRRLRRDACRMPRRCGRI